MFKNYLKLAWKVLGRNKFFTGISLFGISFTLMILMLITAFAESQLGPNQPMTRKDRMVLLPQLTMKLTRPDTTWIRDSTRVAGQMAYDSTLQVVDNTVSTSISSFSYHYVDTYLSGVGPKSDFTLLSNYNSFDIFLSNRKITIDAIYADAAYWRVFDFSFRQGKAFNEGHVENATPAAVITDRTARRVFGSVEGAAGQTIDLGNRQYEVIGVVERSIASHPMTAADVFLPYTTMDGDALTSREYHGPFTVAFLAPTPGQVSDLKADIVQRGTSAPLPNPENYNALELTPLDYFEGYATQLFTRPGGPSESVLILRLVFSGLLLFFILLPTLNLINLNVSRIMEREAEIGVRKAFGAHSGNILYQFIFENVILTLIGGAIGLALAVALIFILNDSQIFPDTILRFNGRVFGYSLFICLAFGVLSGVLPAWRMSRMHIANALKSSQL